VALELKIPAWKLRTWIKNSEEKLERDSELTEIIRLENELKEAREEIEILKKAAAYFAKSQK
jgi:transposase-like protein